MLRLAVNFVLIMVYSKAERAEKRIVKKAVFQL